MENLIDVLNKEHSEYELLLELSEKKTPIIVKGDLEALTKITDEEQVVVSRIHHLDSVHTEVLKDIANVINKDVELLKLDNLIKMLEKQPVEQKKLQDIHDKLHSTIKRLSQINEHNRELLRISLEMVEFDLNLIRAMRTAPETANYSRAALNVGTTMGGEYKGFDAKQ